MKKNLSVKNYIAIADWMLDLNLNTRELLTYALIYGFCQDGEGYYYGSYSYLAHWLGMESSQHVVRYLKPLVEKGLVIKKEGVSKLNQKLCLYKTVNNNGSILNNPDVDYLIIQPWMLQDLHLNGKDLFLYALVHGYSRKESDNVCKYKRDYIAKWLQCQKNNVRRQVDRAVKNGLIKEVDKNSYIAIVPDNISTYQPEIREDSEEIIFDSIDNTFYDKKSQSGSTPENTGLKVGVRRSQSGSTYSLKVGDNNLRDNLIDNLDIINNNNSNQNKTNTFKSKEELSVVVNKYIDTSSLDSFSDEKEFFNFKQQLDFEMYVKYQKRTNLDLAVFMQKCSLGFYRKAFSLWLEKQQGTIQSAATLIFKTITNSQFVKKEGVLTSLSEQDCLVLIGSCFDLFDEDKKPAIKKSNEAYMIGVLNNIVSDKE